MIDTEFVVSSVGKNEDRSSVTFSMIVLDKIGYESKKTNFGLPDMTGYCEKKREAASHHYDLTLDTAVKAKKKMSASFTARERS